MKKIGTLLVVASALVLFGCSGDSSPSKATDGQGGSKNESSSSELSKNSSSSTAKDSSSSKQSSSSVKDSSSAQSSSSVKSSSSTKSSNSATKAEQKQEALVSGDIIASCGPVAPNTAKGDSVTWQLQFLGGSAATYVNGYYTWSLTGAAEEKRKGKGLSVVENVVYNEKGTFAASVNIDGQKIQCDSVYVGGVSVDDCSCVAAKSGVDIQADGGIAAWTVSGCKSEAKITSYEWGDGIEAHGVEGSHVFTEKRQALAPTVTVYNDDDNYAVVECEKVTAYDSNDPDYVFTGNGPDNRIEFPAGESVIQIEFTSDYLCTFACQSDGYNNAVITVEGREYSLQGFVSFEMDHSVCMAGNTLQFKTTMPVSCFFY